MSAVHTSASEIEPDLFGVASAVPAEPTNVGMAPQCDLVIEIQGVLLRAAEVRTKVVGEDQHSVPVLCMDIRPLSGLKRTIHAEQIYSESNRKLADQKAATLKRGAHVTFRTPLTDMRVTFPHVRSVALNPPT